MQWTRAPPTEPIANGRTAREGWLSLPFPDESGAPISTVGAGAQHPRDGFDSYPGLPHCSAVYAPSPRSAFTRAQRAADALRALSLRSASVILAARVVPPILPPLAPIFTKYAKTSGGILFRFAMHQA